MRFGFRDVDPSGIVALDHHPVRVAGAEPAEVLPVEGIASVLVLDFPQALRGASIMLCLLPATRLALERWPQAQIPDASGIFNLMRNLGGAIGIALIDTILEQRTQGHVDRLIERLQARDVEAAREIGIPVRQFLEASGPVDEITKAIVAPMIKRAALAQSFNEAWILIAILFAVSLLALPLMRRAHIDDSPMGPGAH